MVASTNSSNKTIRPQKGLSNKRILSFPLLAASARNSAITWPLSLLFENALRHLVPHAILHLMIYRLLTFSKWQTMLRNKS